MAFGKILLILVSLIGPLNSSSIEGKQIIREIFPDVTDSDIKFGSGYNSIKLTRTGTLPVQCNSTGSRNLQNHDGFISHTSQIKHYSTRADLRAQFQKQSEIAKSESLMGTSKSELINMLSDNHLSILDSFLIVDIDIVTDSQSVTGNVQLTEEGTGMLEKGEYKKFIEKFGTHYLRKKIFGGKILFLIKFSSKTHEEKAVVDKKLKNTVGSLGNDEEFKKKMEEIEELGKLNLVLYTLGGKPYEGDLVLCDVIDFVLKFPQEVLVKDEVRDLEFLASWNIPGIPRGFSQYIFTLQRETDKIVSIFSDLRHVETQIDDIVLLRYIEMTWIDEDGAEKLQEVEDKSIQSRIELTQKFTYGEMEGLHNVTEEYEDVGEQLEAEIEDILKAEKEFQECEHMYLKSVEHPRYVSSSDYQGYASAHRINPIPLHFYRKCANGVTYPMLYSRSYKYYLKSKVYPGKVLCMAPHYTGIFWKTGTSVYPPYCTWSLKHATDPRKTTVEYGDQFLLYNVYWPDWSFGLDDNLRWIVGVDDDDIDNELDKMKWELEKIQSGPI